MSRYQLDRADFLEWAPAYAERIARGEALPFHAAFGDLPYLLDFMAGGQRDAPHKQLQREQPEAVAALCNALGLLPWQSAAILWFKAVGLAVRSVCYPGALFVAFGGSRTSDLLAVGLRAAGWHVFDQLQYLYGSSMPHGQHLATALTGEAAALFHDYHSQLKPAFEPLIVARAPFDGTLAQIATRYGTGALNIGGGRVATNGERPLREVQRDGTTHGGTGGLAVGGTQAGRFAANVVIDHTPACVLLGLKAARNPSGDVPAVTASRPAKHANGATGRKAATAYGDAAGVELVEDWSCAPGCPVAALDAQSGVTRAMAHNKGQMREHGLRGPHADHYQTVPGTESVRGYNDVGGASRFFYTSKATAWERIASLPPGTDNPHPTLKSIRTLEYIANLIRPPFSFAPRLLIPTAGVGSEMIAALLAGWSFVHGVELDQDRAHPNAYIGIAQARLQWWAQFGTFAAAEDAYYRGRERERAAEKLRDAYRAAGVEQLSLI